MRRIRVEASRSYEVLIERGLLDRAGEVLRGVTKAEKALLVAGENVGPLYAGRVQRSLEAAGFQVCPVSVPSGEGAKSLATYARVLSAAAGAQLGLSDVFVALGGGVTGDLTGFAAATWQRGADFVQIPTTLLAMVDSSVGGKTALNLVSGKNQVGAFYQPCAVLCDPDTLRTLPEREYRAGSAEVLKYALLGDAAFFESLERTPIRAQEEAVIEKCVTMKRDIVRQDEFDRGLRQLLNLGHSFGHAIEACSGFSILHGEAVAAGMALMARAAAEKGCCSAETAERTVAALRRLGLPTETDFSCEELENALLADKKRRGGVMNLVVPREIGRCDIVPVPLGELGGWLRAGGAA